MDPLLTRQRDDRTGEHSLSIPAQVGQRSPSDFF